MRNSSLVKRLSADNTRDLNITPKLRIYKDGREAFYLRRRYMVMYAGANRKENVGMSNDNEDEKSSHRKSKDS